MGFKGWAAQILPLPIIILTLILRLATCGFHPRRGVEFHRAPALPVDTVLQGCMDRAWTPRARRGLIAVTWDSWGSERPKPALSAREFDRPLPVEHVSVVEFHAEHRNPTKSHANPTSR